MSNAIHSFMGKQEGQPKVFLQFECACIERTSIVNQTTNTGRHLFFTGARKEGVGDGEGKGKGGKGGKGGHRPISRVRTNRSGRQGMGGPIVVVSSSLLSLFVLKEEGNPGRLAHTCRLDVSPVK
jgi:hypothetical protein